MHQELVKMGIYKALAEKRILYLDGDITGKWADVVHPALLLLNTQSEDQVTLYMNSVGGGFPQGLDIYDAVRLSKAPVHGIVYRKAMSMAAVILQACHKRSMMRHARLFIHGVQKNGPLTAENLRNPKWVEETLSDFDQKNNEMVKIYVERTRQSEEIVREWISKDTEFTAEEALNSGLIDEIL